MGKEKGWVWGSGELVSDGASNVETSETNNILLSNLCFNDNYFTNYSKNHGDTNLQKLWNNLERFLIFLNGKQVNN